MSAVYDTGTSESVMNKKMKQVENKVLDYR